MRRLDLATAFRAILGWFIAAPLAFALVGLVTPPDPVTQLVYGVPLAFGCGLGGAYAAVRARVEPRRLAWALVTFYLVSFAALVAIQTVADATVGWIQGPWDDVASLAVGALLAYWVGFRRH
ncbi:hypothetical protein [Halarchaeum sp. P4]|uniref:hypothetical protein n=1 Tax=Halarchaeum sp. P4 TaxID=3421639 RepID=UPI003EC0E0A5